jgi:23S rRNA (cytidine1920-2'-O)/16S rRNA (cytidine1409-2'-O)-methyltransferase
VARFRLDVLMVERGLAESRARAQSLILGGGVTVDGRVVTKPASSVPAESVVSLVREPLPYVSRGGLKLAHALEQFGIDVRGVVAADVGSSTGGFTDVLLQRGAAKVYAIDVGYGQLAWTLRNDPRVIVMERTNVRHLKDLPEKIGFSAIDVSFISLRLVLPVVRGWMQPDRCLVCLIKPQFEAGRKRVGKGGVVRDPAVWSDALRSVLEGAVVIGFSVTGLQRSPIRGPAGNVEFLVHLTSRGGKSIDLHHAIGRVVAD